MSDRLLKIDEVQSRVNFSRSAIYQMMSRGQFPAAIKISSRAVFWAESSINSWIDSQVRSGGAPQAA